MPLSALFSQVQPDENPFQLGAGLGFNCDDLEVVAQYQTAKAFWYATHGELMVTFAFGWLRAYNSPESDWKEAVATACAVARLGLDAITDTSHRAEAEAALEAAEDWAAGGPTITAEVLALASIVRTRFEENEESPDALDGVWSACVYVTQVPYPFHGDDTTYAAAAALIRERHPAPPASGWEVFT